MIIDEQIHLLDELQNVLDKQIELVRQGGLSNLETLSRDANSLVEKIVQTGILELSEYRYWRERLQKLYDNLCLAITAQKTDTAERLSRVHKGKKLLDAYAGSSNNKA